MKSNLREVGPLGWRLQLQDALCTQNDLTTRLAIDSSQLSDFQEITDRYPAKITPYYASLIDPDDPQDPIARMCIPSSEELAPTTHLLRDPLAEEEHMPVPNLIHRYRDRAVILATTSCATYCRHCTRKRLVGQQSSLLGHDNLQKIVVYLKNHPEVWDIIISGGDPLLLDDEQLISILDELRAIETVGIIRIGTRIPAVMPMRITASLAQLLAHYKPLFINTHFNHPRELTPAALQACELLVDCGIVLNNQTVLLAGVNDSAGVIEELCRNLLRARIRPYYLLLCDLTEGVEHLRTSLAGAMEIMEFLRGRLSGLAIPTCVVDTPYGGGKIPLTPQYIISQAPGRTVLRNFAGQMIVYPDPACERKQRSYTPAEEGISGLLNGAFPVLKPSRETG